MTVKDNNPSKLSELGAKITIPTSNAETFTTNRIVWGYDIEPTIIREGFESDPLISLYVKFYNTSKIATNRAKGWKVTHKNSIDLLLQQVIYPAGGTPDNFLEQYLHVLKKEKLVGRISGSTDYRYYFSARFVPFNLTPNVSHLKGRRTDKIRNSVPITAVQKEMLYIWTSPQNMPSMSTPSYGGRNDVTTIHPTGYNGKETIESLRLFCAWVINLLSELKKNIHEKCPKEVKLLENLAKKSGVAYDVPKNDETIFDDETNTTLRTIDITYRIAKKIDSQELFEYLFFSSIFSANRLPIQLSRLYDPAIMAMSQEHEILDYKNIIRNHFMGVEETFTFDRNKHLDKRILYYVPEWSDIIVKNYVISPLDILGLSTLEQVLMALLLATDRHQESNLFWAKIDDITETKNSISTVINFESLKKRARRIAGTNVKISETEDSGQVYKRLSKNAIYNALKNYKNSLQFSYDNEYYRTSEKWLFPTLRKNESVRPSLIKGPFNFHLGNSSLRFLYTVTIENTFLNKKFKNFAGIKHAPVLELFKEASRKCKHTNKCLNVNDTRITIGFISRTKVNYDLDESYGAEAIKLRNNRPNFTENELEDDIRKITALRANHTQEVRADVYANKLPSQYTNSRKFASYVGDEMVKIASSVADTLLNQTEALTLSKARKLLGLQNAGEIEDEQINNFLAEAESSDFNINELGFLTKSGQKIVINTPLTIALIFFKIQAIDEGIEDLLTNNFDRAKIIISERIYLQLILDELFTRSEVRTAVNRYKKYPFKFNDIRV